MGYLIMTKPGCSFCVRAKELLKENGIEFEEINHDTPEKIERFKENGYKTFPQIFEDGTLIGGFTDLQEHLEF